MTVNLNRVTRNDTAVPACALNTKLFQHPLLEDGVASGAAQRRHQRELRETASAVCERCPLMDECLYQAVVDHDVAGFVAGTTEPQRMAMRRRLNVHVEPDDLSAWAGMRESQHRIGTDDVLALRAQRPDDSLKQLALHLGCSLSTVKRHLRTHRNQQTGAETSRSASRRTRPTLDEVLIARDIVLGRMSRVQDDQAA